MKSYKLKVYSGKKLAAETEIINCSQPGQCKFSYSVLKEGNISPTKSVTIKGSNLGGMGMEMKIIKPKEWKVYDGKVEILGGELIPWSLKNK